MEKFLNKENLKKIKNILIKKSEGYFFSEEVLEYQNNTKPTENEKVKQITIFNEDENENKPNEENKDLTLIKKKVTTHYVPPDLLAIKMLIEIFGKEVIEKDEDDNLTSLSDNELMTLKKEVIQKLNEL